VERSGRPEYFYKGQAIQSAGNELRTALNDEWLNIATLVPIPPSACRDDPMYDDRMTQVLRVMVRDLRADIRELIRHRQSVVPAHVSGDYRPRVQEIFENYEIDETLTDPAPTSIGLFDDILTAGSHFRAAKLLLQERFPDVPVIGVFVARRVFPPDFIAL
jgi:predicted amidophosphoribosyltransferase